MYKLEKVFLQLFVIHSHWLEIRLSFLWRCNCNLHKIIKQ